MEAPHVWAEPAAEVGKRRRPPVERAQRAGLEDGGVAPACQRVIFANLGTMPTAAVDDRLIPHSPCRSSSVRAPEVDPRRIAP